MKNRANINLVCLPFAGAGASTFNEWLSISDHVRVVAVELPGRETKFTERLYTHVEEAVSGIIPELLRDIDTFLPVVLFGHSLGAILAFELASALEKLDQVTIAAVIVSGSPNPWELREQRATGLPDDEFFQRVNKFAGYNHPAIDNPMFRELFLPVLRADVEMHEHYKPKNNERIDAPIVTLRGSQDELVSAEQKLRWNQASLKQVTHKELPGGHMYLVDHAKDIVALIEALYVCE
jgi:surfactin synthase thioesterase subunit